MLRRELKTARTRSHSLETELGLRKRREKKVEDVADLDPIIQEKDKVIDLQMNEIRRLNLDLEILRKEIEKRPQSGPKLPPMQT